MQQPTLPEQPEAAPLVQLPCPWWCTVDHAKTDPQERYVDPVMDLRTHSRTVLKVPNPHAGPDHHLWVDVCVTDDLNEGTREAMRVNVDGAEGLTPELVLELVSGLSRAVALVTAEGARMT